MNQAILVAFKAEADREAVRHTLSSCIPVDQKMMIEQADNFASAMQELKSRRFACAFIELCDGEKPSESDGIETPIVFVVDHRHPELSTGKNWFPHLFCEKSEFDRNWTKAYLPLTFENNRLHEELKIANQLLEHFKLDKEINSLTSWHYRTTNTAQSMGLPSVRASAPEKFDEFVHEYCELIEAALEERTFKVAASSSPKLHSLSQRLGLLNAGPRDVIELYATSLKQSTETVSGARGRALSSCAQMLALELMGYLVGFYRNLVCFALIDEKPGVEQ